MMRRTVTLTVEIEGTQPDALALRNAVLRLSGTRGDWEVTDAVVIADAYDRGPAPTKDAGPDTGKRP